MTLLDTLRRLTLAIVAAGACLLAASAPAQARDRGAHLVSNDQLGGHLGETIVVRTTLGSPIFADNVPEKSNILVERIEANGGIVYAKSNTPEFGAGANTFNEVFGATRNPWNTARSAAGSSGGAAVALATGMAWVAHGSDMGGSLRNPASFCGVADESIEAASPRHTPRSSPDPTHDQETLRLRHSSPFRRLSHVQRLLRLCACRPRGSAVGNQPFRLDPYKRRAVGPSSRDAGYGASD